MSKRITIPKVRIAKPSGRRYQLRYTDPKSNKEIRISCGTRDDDEAEQQRAKLVAKLTLGLETKRKRKTTGPDMYWEDFRE